MQATLTMDKSQFDQGKREALHDIEQIKNAYGSLPAASGHNVGKDAPDPNPREAEEKIHRTRQQQKAEQQATDSSITQQQISDIHAVANAEGQAVQKRKAHHSDLVRHQLDGINEVAAAHDNLLRKMGASSVAHSRGTLDARSLLNEAHPQAVHPQSINPNAPGYVDPNSLRYPGGKMADVDEVAIKHGTFGLAGMGGGLGQNAADFIGPRIPGTGEAGYDAYIAGERTAYQARKSAQQAESLRAEAEYQQQIEEGRRRAAELDASRQSVVGTGQNVVPASSMGDNDYKQAELGVTRTRNAQMRIRRGLPTNPNEQVDDDGNPLTSAEYRSRYGTEDTTVAEGEGRHGRHASGEKMDTEGKLWEGLLGNVHTRGDMDNLTYQRYIARSSFRMEAATSALEPIAPGLASALPMLAGPELLAVGALGLFSEALHKASESLSEYTSNLSIQRTVGEEQVRAGQRTPEQDKQYGDIAAYMAMQGAQYGLEYNKTQEAIEGMGTYFSPQEVQKYAPTLMQTSLTRNMDLGKLVGQFEQAKATGVTSLGTDLYGPMAAGSQQSYYQLLQEMQQYGTAEQGKSFETQSWGNILGAMVSTIGKGSGNLINAGPAASGIGPQKPGATPSEGGTPGDANLVRGAMAQVVAVRQIKDELADSEGAITGVQKVFSELTTFHIDWSMVKPQLGNLRESVIELQKFWYETARSQNARLEPADVQVLTGWINATKSIVELTDTMSGVAAKVHSNRGLTISHDDLLPIEKNLEVLYEFAAKQADKAYGNAGNADLFKAETAKIAGYTEAMKGFVDLSAGLNALLTQTFSTPIPDDKKISDTIDASFKMVGAIMGRMSKAFMTVDPKQAGDMLGVSGHERLGDLKMVVDQKLADAAQVSDGVNKMLSVGAASVSLIQNMSNMWIPGDDVIKKVAATTVGISMKLAAAISDAVANADYGKDSFAGASVGPADAQTMLNQSAENAPKINAILAAASAGVGMLQGMTNLWIPDVGTQGKVVGALISVAKDFAKESATMTDNDIAQVKKAGEAFGPAMQAVGAGVQALQGMRNMVLPDAGQKGGFRAAMREMEEWARSDALDKDTGDKIRQGGEAYSAAMQAYSAGAQALQAIHQDALPTEGKQAEFNAFFDRQKGLASQLDPQTADRIKQAGDAYSAYFQSLSSGSQWLSKVYDMVVPGDDKINAVFDIEMRFEDKFSKRAQSMSKTQTVEMTEAGQAWQAMFGAILSGASLLDKLPTVHKIPEDMIDGLFGNLDSLSDGIRKHFATMKARGDFEYAAYADELGKEFTALTTVADFQNKLGVVRADYTPIIDAFFDNTMRAVHQFAARVPQLKEMVNDVTVDTAKRMGDTFEGLGKAINPIEAMSKAAQVSPGMIHASMENVKKMVIEFFDMSKMPELQGENGARMKSAADVVGTIGTAAKNIADAAQSLTQNNAMVGGKNLASIMAPLFTQAASVGPVGRGGNAGVADNHGIVISGDLVISGQDAKEIMRIVTNHVNTQNGGVAVMARK